MNEVEEAVQKNIIALKNNISKHKLESEKTIPVIIDLISTLIIQSEELVHIESVQSNSLFIVNYNELKERLLQVVLGEIDETLFRIKNKMMNLKRIGEEMKNYIDKLEKSSINLDWQFPSRCIDGNECQPPLGQLLQYCLEYRCFLSENTDIALNMLYNINVRKRKSLDDFKNFLSFKLFIPIEDTLIAFTQYITKV